MSGSGREALPILREGSGGPCRCLAVVGTPSWMCGSGREALSDVREWSGVNLDVGEWSEGHPGCLKVVGRPFRMSGVIVRPSRVVGMPPDVREWSGGPLRCPGFVWRPSRMSGSGRESLPNVRE